MSNVMELSLRGASNLEKLMRAVLLDSENKVPAERLRIVGAIADGAIIEQGSNTNGEWVRLANGTQICLYRGTTTEEENSANGKIFTFPAAFFDVLTTKLVCSPARLASGTTAATTVVESSVVSASTYIIKILVPTDDGITASASSLGFHAIAIGRWKA